MVRYPKTMDVVPTLVLELYPRWVSVMRLASNLAEKKVMRLPLKEKPLAMFHASHGKTKVTWSMDNIHTLKPNSQYK